MSFADPSDYDRLELGAALRMNGIIGTLKAARNIHLQFDGSDTPITVRHNLSAHQIDVLAAGGAINWQRQQQRAAKRGQSHENRC